MGPSDFDLIHPTCPASSLGQENDPALNCPKLGEEQQRTTLANYNLSFPQLEKIYPA